MKIDIRRKTFAEHYTLGELSIDGVFQCFTLEDAVREMPGHTVEEWKVAGETAVPVGTYALDCTFSKRFNRYLPLLLDVPGFAGVRIHSGNTDADTEGCILVGETETVDWVGNSRVAFGNLWTIIAEYTGRLDPHGIAIFELREPTLVTIAGH